MYRLGDFIVLQKLFILDAKLSDAYMGLRCAYFIAYFMYFIVIERHRKKLSIDGNVRILLVNFWAAYGFNWNCTKN